MFEINEAKTSVQTVGVAEKIIKLARFDDRIYAITADVAHSTDFELIKKALPNRFFNVGIAEQNAIAVASGLSRVGLKPYVGMFSSFASKRALDFIFADVCYPSLPVTIIGTHGGTSFGEAGPTHHALSDLTILRSMPNLTVIVPSDRVEAEKAVEASARFNKPLYIRINRGEDFCVTSPETPFEIGKAVELKEGKDLSIIACGACVAEGLIAAKELESRGVSVAVINMHTIKPLDKGAVLKAMKTGRIITCEDGRNTGLGGAVAETIADSGSSCKLARLGIDGICKVGRKRELMKNYGIDSAGIIAAAEKLL